MKLRLTRKTARPASPSSRTRDVERLVHELLASSSVRETGEIAIRHADWYDASFFAAVDAFIARERAKPGGSLAARLAELPGYLRMVKMQVDGGKIQRMKDDLAIGEAMERIEQPEQAAPAGDDRAALDEAVARQRELVQLAPVGYHDRGVFLSNLAGALMQRFERFGSVGDLDEAISLVRTAMQAAPPGSAARADFLANLHVALMRKYQHTQAPGDRDEAIDAARLATQSTPDGHPLRGIRLGGLGTALLRRYDQTHAAEDADEAVGVLRAALKVIPAGDTEHDKIASLLSVALLERSGHARRA
jgi:tetratricopeptide (TPR) repeat protein